MTDMTDILKALNELKQQNTELLVELRAIRQRLDLPAEEVPPVNMEDLESECIAQDEDDPELLALVAFGCQWCGEVFYTDVWGLGACCPICGRPTVLVRRIKETT